MEFYFGGPNSNSWNDSSKLESYIQKMERSFETKSYLTPILIISSILLACLLFAAH
jgi:hypothetical protein